MIYAAFIGLLLASYLTPLQQILADREQTPRLEQRLEKAQGSVEAKEREAESLKTPEGIEAAARERYGMISPGDKVYIVPDSGKSSNRTGE